MDFWLASITQPFMDSTVFVTGMSAAQASVFAPSADIDRERSAGSHSAAIQQVSIMLAAMAQENMETAVFMRCSQPHKLILLHQHLMLSATCLLSCLLLQQLMAIPPANMDKEIGAAPCL